MLQTIQILRALRALLGIAAIALSACGGSEPADDSISDERAQPAAFTPLPDPVPAPVTSPSIARAPQAATVALGAGVRFSVLATGFPPLTYRWHKNGVAVPGAPGAGSSYDIAAATLNDATTYMVRVADRFGSTATASAALTAVPNGWAQLGGRVIVSSSASQQPALTLCDGPTLAWIDTAAGAAGTLRVSRFSGTQWLTLGAPLNASATADAAEPSIDCLETGSTRRPVVAWSESSGTGRAIFVKSWDGSAWVASPSVGTAEGANARKPVLRLAADRGETTAPLLRGRSALAWVENGFARAKLWNGTAWQPYTGGFPSGSGLNEIALALDRSRSTGGLFDHPPLIASVKALPAGQSAVSAQVNGVGWAALGQSASAASSATVAKQIAGIGFSSDTSGPGHAATALWVERTVGRGGSNIYAVVSSQLLGNAYDSALLQPLLPQPAWGAFAGRLEGYDLQAFSIDPHPVSTQCHNGASRPTFAMAINDSRGTGVLIANCWGGESDPLTWATQEGQLPGLASGLSLRIEVVDGFNAPVLALSQGVGGRHEMSVWRFYR